MVLRRSTGTPASLTAASTRRKLGLGVGRTACVTRNWRSAWAQATNVYVRTAQGWRIVAHHVSPGSLQPPPVTSTEAPATLH